MDLFTLLGIPLIISNKLEFTDLEISNLYPTDTFLNVVALEQVLSKKVPFWLVHLCGLNYNQVFDATNIKI